MDFHRAFEEIDEDGSGIITVDELTRYMNRMNYKEAFVNKWLKLFDINHDGEISYDEYCETLGLIPKKEVVERARRISQMSQMAIMNMPTLPSAVNDAMGRRVSLGGVELGQAVSAVTQTRGTGLAGRRMSMAAAITSKSFPIAETLESIHTEESSESIEASHAQITSSGLPFSTEVIDSSGITRGLFSGGKNYALSDHGIMRHSKSSMISRKAKHRYGKIKDKKLKQAIKAVAEAEAAHKAAATTDKDKVGTITKQVGGDKNGGTRLVSTTKSAKTLETQMRKTKKQMRRKKVFSEHKRRLRPGMVPGTVLILLVGRHRGKRVVFLKQLKSGLLLVTGPYKCNGVPLRRVNQRYVIATRTRVNMEGIDIPKRLSDAYFKRAPKAIRRANAKAGKSNDIFASSGDSDYTVNEERKEDQKIVDKQIRTNIIKSQDGKLLMAYLQSLFSLGKRDYPHKMVF